MGAALSPSKAQESCSSHEEGSPHAFRVAFSYLWNLSTIPLDWGWKAVVVMGLAPTCFHQEDHVEEVNWTPLSDVITAGTPYLATHVATKASSTASAVVDFRGTA